MEKVKPHLQSPWSDDFCSYYGHSWGIFGPFSVPSPALADRPAPVTSEKPVLQKFRFRKCLRCDVMQREDATGNIEIVAGSEAL